MRPAAVEAVGVRDRLLPSPHPGAPSIWCLLGMAPPPAWRPPPPYSARCSHLWGSRRRRPGSRPTPAATQSPSLRLWWPPCAARHPSASSLDRGANRGRRVEGIPIGPSQIDVPIRKGSDQLGMARRWLTALDPYTTIRTIAIGIRGRPAPSNAAASHSSLHLDSFSICRKNRSHQ